MFVPSIFKNNSLPPKLKPVHIFSLWKTVTFDILQKAKIKDIL